MNKRHAYHFLKRLERVNVWYFVVAIIVCGLIGGAAYRNNNVRSIELREKVIAADQANGNVEQALAELREHIYTHMNGGLATPTPPVQLKYRYERLVAVEKERVSTANSKLTTAAQQHCEALIPVGASRGRIDCIQNYLTTHGTVEQPIPDALYKFDFASPVWSPDVAGWMLFLTAVLSIILVCRILTVSWLRHRVN